MTDDPPSAALTLDRLPEVRLASVRLHAVREPQCVAYVMRSLAAGRGGWIATANLDHLRRLQRPGEFRRVYQNATVVVADGMPLVWACRLQGTPIPERVAGSDLIHSLAAAAAKHGRSVFLLGGDPGTAEAAAARLMAAYPGLNVAGTFCPRVGFQSDPDQMDELRRAVTTNHPDIVFVALGSPKQELLIDQVRAAVSTAWWIGVGISFSFVAGDVQRAPRWVQRLGLEWSHRLLQEPRRLWTRYLWYGPPFLVRLFARALCRRVGMGLDRTRGSGSNPEQIDVRSQGR